MRILPVLASQVKPDQYRAIVRPALEYGFEKNRSGSWIGDSGIQLALNQAASVVDAANHHAFAEALLTWLGERGGLKNRERWFCHAIRRLIGKLLANANCSEDDCDELIAHHDEAEIPSKQLSSEDDISPPSDYKDGFTDQRGRRELH
jgi:hypothetical protein